MPDLSMKEILKLTASDGCVPDPSPAKKLPMCWLCKKPIKKKVHYQGGSAAHPAHKKCLIKPC
jgi:hypothetical protein